MIHRRYPYSTWYVTGIIVAFVVLLAVGAR